MKALVALITINGKVTLKVSLQPEDQKDLDFLRDAIEKNPEINLSFADGITPTPDWGVGKE